MQSVELIAGGNIYIYCCYILVYKYVYTSMPIRLYITAVLTANLTPTELHSHFW